MDPKVPRLSASNDTKGADRSHRQVNLPALAAREAPKSRTLTHNDFPSMHGSGVAHNVWMYHRPCQAAYRYSEELYVCTHHPSPGFKAGMLTGLKYAGMPNGKRRDLRGRDRPSR